MNCSNSLPLINNNDASFASFELEHRFLIRFSVFESWKQQELYYAYEPTYADSSMNFNFDTLVYSTALGKFMNKMKFNFRVQIELTFFSNKKKETRNIPDCHQNLNHD